MTIPLKLGILVALNAWVLVAQPNAPEALVDGLVLVHKNGPATLLIDKPLEKGEASLGLADFLTIVVQVDGAASLEVKPPDVVSKSKGWRLVRSGTAGKTEVEKGRFRWRQSFLFEPLAPGELPLQLEPFEIRDEKTESHALSWQPLSVRVTTSVNEPDLKNLRDPTVLEPPPPAEPKTEPLAWIAVVLLLGANVIVGLVWLSHRKKPQPTTLKQRAARQLDRVQKLRLSERGESALLYRLLANIVRRYLDRKLNLRARHLTTAEFLVALQSSQKLSESQVIFLRDFFALCDLAKFAGSAVSEKDETALIDDIRAFIREHSTK